MSISKYYKMDPDDITSVGLEQFPENAPALGTDADGNPINAGDSIYKVKVNSSDATADYLSDKLADTKDVAWDATSDNSELESTVIQLTGKGASLVIKHVQDVVGNELAHTVGPGITGFQYGRGCTPGYTYKLSEISGQKERIHTWIAQSSNGKMYRSYDNFQTGYLDTGLVDGAGSTIATNQYGAQCLAYVKLVDGSYVWAVFVGNSSGYFKCLDVPSSYNNDGSFVSGAWSWVDFVDSGLSYSGAPPYHNICHLTQATNGGVFVTSSSTSRIFYSEDLLTWTAVVVSTSGEIAGICTDHYGTYLGVHRDTGVIYRNNSELSGTFDETAWSPIASITVTDPSGVKTVTTNLPINGGTWWAGFGCAYGLWVCTVAKKGSTSDPVYAYSDDSINWYTYGGAADSLIAVWEMSTDGALWFGCPVGSATPLVYQLLVNSIPAKKRFIAEKGLMVVGDAFLQDLPDASILSTDENGKIIEKSLVTEVKAVLSDEHDVLFEESGSVLKNTVYQLTGVGAKLVPVTTDFDWQYDPTHVSTYNWGGRGIAAGRVYLDGIEVNVWGVQETSGYLRFSADFWKSSYLDDSLVTYIGGAQPNTIQTPSLHFIHLGGAYNCDAWVCGIYPSGSGVYVARHLPTNYNVNGTIKSTAWELITAGYLVADMASFGDVTCLNGDHGNLMRTVDWATFTTPLTVSGVIRGIAADRKGNWIAIRRDQSDIYYSADDGLTWTQPQIYVNDVAVSSLLSAIGSTLSITAGNGVFLVLGVNGYAYSEDGLHWTSVPVSLSFACVGFDGVRFFATNASTLEGSNEPKIWQLLVDQIAALRHLVAEDGMTVDKELYLPNLPSATVLGTDEIGRVVEKTIDLTSHGKFMPTMDPAVAAAVMIPSLVGTRNEICVVAIPRIDMKINSTTKFSCAITQGGTGTIILTLRDSNFNLIASSLPITDPTGNALLTADLDQLENPTTHSPVTEYELSAGVVYYLGINYSINGAAYLGVVASQTMNVTPISSKKFDNLSSAPDTLSGGSETLMRPYVAVTSE